MNTPANRRLKFLLFSFLFISLSFNYASAAVLDKVSPSPVQKPDQVKESEEPKYIPGEVIVKLRSKDSVETLFTKSYSERQSADESKLTGLKTKYNLRDNRPVFKDLHKKLKANNLSQGKLREQDELKEQTQKKYRNKRTKRPKTSKPVDLLPIYVLNTDQDVVKICEELKNDPDVEYAEPNFIMKAQMIPNDPYYPSNGCWGLRKIGCEQAWDATQGKNVVVAVVDSGVDYNHEDIAENIWLNIDETPGDGIDNDNNGYIDDARGWDFIGSSHVNPREDNDPMDIAGHGTQCAGIIAAVGNNNIGVIGVAPKAKIMIVKGLSDSGVGSSSALADCVRYAADNGADVISSSWGSYNTQQILTDAFHYADSLGVVCVAGAGNDNKDMSDFTPANIDTVIAVAATDPQDNKASFSNYGSKIAVSAPGVGILLLSANGASTGTYYAISSGTSYAGPHVAGMAALIASEYPTFSNNDIRTRILASCEDLGISGKDTYFGFGRINSGFILDPPDRIWIISISAADIAGDGDGKVEQGETIALTVTLETFASDLSNVSATLRSGDPFAAIQNSFSTFGNIQKSTPADNSAGAFTFIVNNDCPAKHSIDFTLNITADGYSADEFISITVLPAWPLKTGAFSITSSPAVADINGDGDLETLVGSDDGYLYCVNKEGNFVWRYQTGGAVQSPAVADIDRDGDLEILAGSGDGYLYCLDKAGDLAWRYQTGEGIYSSSPAIADINGDGDLEILFGSNDCYLYCLDKTGKLAWRYQTGWSIQSSPAVADINGDGDLEILVSSYDSYLYCINKTGGLVWMYRTDKPINSSPSVADINGDDDIEILVGSNDGYLYCMDKEGNLEWRYQIGTWTSSSPVIADINGDSDLEILIGSGDKYLYCIDKEGGLAWRYQTGSWISSSPSVADINGDGDLEILIGSYDKYLYCVDKTGNLVWRYLTLGSVESSPAIADINGDGDFETLVGSNDGYLYCIDKDGHDYIPTPTGAIDPMSWPMFRHDIRRTGLYSSGNRSPETYAEWKAVKFTTAQQENPLISGKKADPDYDMFTNEWEYIFNINPLVRDPISVSTYYMLNGFYTMRFRLNARMKDMTIRIATSEDLRTWRYDKISFARTAIDADTDLVIATEIDHVRARFFRLEIVDTSSSLPIATRNMDDMPPQYYFSLTVTVNGIGSVTSADGSINCISTCVSDGLSGSAKTLIARPGAGYRFAGWSGAYSGSESQCVVTYNASKQITASFIPDNRPPVLDLIGNKSVARGKTLEFTLNSNDPDGDKIIYSIVNKPIGSKFSDTTGAFSWRPGVKQSGAFSVTFIATDPYNGRSEETITITVLNGAPVLSQIWKKIIKAGQKLSFKLIKK